MVKPAPGAAGQAIGPLQAGDAGLDAGPEVSELSIHPAAPDHVFDPEAALLVVEGHVAYTPGPCPHKRRVFHNKSKYLLFMDGHQLDDSAMPGCSPVWHVFASETAAAELTDFHARFA